MPERAATADATRTAASDESAHRSRRFRAAINVPTGAAVRRRETSVDHALGVHVGRLGREVRVDVPSRARGASPGERELDGMKVGEREPGVLPDGLVERGEDRLRGGARRSPAPVVARLAKGIPDLGIARVATDGLLECAKQAPHLRPISRCGRTWRAV
jgi:hypothetical protein